MKTALQRNSAAQTELNRAQSKVTVTKQAVETEIPKLREELQKISKEEAAERATADEAGHQVMQMVGLTKAHIMYMADHHLKQMPVKVQKAKGPDGKVEQETPHKRKQKKLDTKLKNSLPKPGKGPVVALHTEESIGLKIQNEVTQKRAMAMFLELDANHDGNITKTELVDGVSLLLYLYLLHYAGVHSRVRTECADVCTTTDGQEWPYADRGRS